MAGKRNKNKKKKKSMSAVLTGVLLLCIFVLTGIIFATGEEGLPLPGGWNLLGGSGLSDDSGLSDGSGLSDLGLSDGLGLSDSGLTGGFHSDEGGKKEEMINIEGQTGTLSGSIIEERLVEYIDNMSLEEKVGQMFLIRCPEGKPANAVRKYQPGGMIFFARDFQDKGPDQIQAETAEYQAACGVPMLMAVDEEGGTVNRVSRYTQYRAVPFWGPQELYASGGWKLIESDTKEKCELLSSLGLNLNMAPVCDMTTDTSAYIYPRTFGAGVSGTSEYVKRVVSVMSEEGVGSVLKHFPGYGENGDTHKGFSVDSRSYESFETSDFLPFQAGIEAGAGAVLVSHNIVECMDSQFPASLSPAVHEVLRKKMGFNGVIMTDDLYMNAIVDSYGQEEAAVMAVQAGNDMICCTDYKTQIPAVIAAVENGEIDETQVDASVLRVLKWKYDLGLVEVDTEA